MARAFSLLVLVRSFILHQMALSLVPKHMGSVSAILKTQLRPLFPSGSCMMRDGGSVKTASLLPLGPLLAQQEDLGFWHSLPGRKVCIGSNLVHDGHVVWCSGSFFGEN